MKMSCCSARCALILLCCLQLLSAVERQALDFLGYQWGPILVNFLHIIAVILGLFGVVQQRPSYVTMYLLWSLLWFSWNIFICCFYLDLGGLSKDSDLLTLGLSPHRSWWRDHGRRCRGHALPSAAGTTRQNPELSSVQNCWLEFQHLEVLHSCLQMFLCLWSLVNGCYVISRFSEDEERFDFFGDFHHPEKLPQVFL